MTQLSPFGFAVLSAVAILVLGVVLAAVVAALIRPLVRRLLKDDQQARRLATLTSSVVVAVFAIAAIARLTGSNLAAAGLSAASARLFGGLPNLLVALLLVVLGLALAVATRAVLRRLLEEVQPAAADLVAPAGYWIILGLTLLLAADQVGVETGVVERLLLLVLGGLVLAVSLALGLGSRELIAAVVAGRHVAQVVGTGDDVEVDGQRGRVVALGPASVRLIRSEGEVEIPNRVFLERPVVVHNRAGL